MEFQYLNGQNTRTTSPPPRPLSNVAYFSRCPLRGYEFVPGSFSSNVSVLKVLPMTMSVNVEEAFQQELENEQIRRELEKEEIKRKIIAGEMALARRRELKEEVRREMVSERAFRIPMQRSEGILFNNNNSNVFGGSQFQLTSHFHNRQDSTQNSKNKVILLVSL